MTTAVLPLEVEEYLTWLATEKGRSANTLAAYRRDLRGYAAWLQERGTALAEVEPTDVEAYVGALRDDGQGAGLGGPGDRGRALDARLLRGGGDPARRPGGRRRAAERAPRAAQGAERGGGRAPAGRGRRHRPGGPPRPGDPGGPVRHRHPHRRAGRACRWAPLDLDDALVRVLGKGSKERVIPVGRLAREALAEWLDTGGRPAMAPDRWARRGDAEAVFLNQRGGRLTRQGAWGIVQEHGRRAGLERKLSPHALRHSCATHMLDHGADIRAVQELLGHASISTTQIYTGVSVERLFAVYGAAHPRAR